MADARDALIRRIDAERVPVGEFLDVVRVHTLSAYDCLVQP